jgi:hypothetical protein
MSGLSFCSFCLADALHVSYVFVRVCKGETSIHWLMNPGIDDNEGGGKAQNLIGKERRQYIKPFLLLGESRYVACETSILLVLCVIVCEIELA